MSAMMCRLLHCWQNPGLLTDTYLTSHVSKVLYVSSSNSNLPVHGKFFFIHFCLSVPWCFLLLWDHFDILKFFTFSITFVKLKRVSSFPENVFAVTLVCCKMEINPNALCLWICLNAQRKKNIFQSFFGNEWVNMVSKIWCKPEQIRIKVWRNCLLFVQ